LELAFKQRMVGAIFILSLGVILIPVLFDSPHVENKAEIHKPKTPQMPDVASVNQINYVFNDLEPNFAKADQTPMVDVEPEQKVAHEAVQPELQQHLAAVAPAPVSASAAVVHPVPAPVPSTTDVTDDNDNMDLEQSKPVTPPPTVKTAVASLNVKPELSIEKWTIQLGAFSSRQNASVLLKKLTKQGFESYVKDDKPRKLVRVFVAPGVNHNNAQVLLSRLDKELGIKGMIVKFNED
jgi:DedD protein